MTRTPREREAHKVRVHMLITAGIFVSGVMTVALPTMSEAGLWVSVMLNTFWVWAD